MSGKDDRHLPRIRKHIERADERSHVGLQLFEEAEIDAGAVAHVRLALVQGIAGSSSSDDMLVCRDGLDGGKARHTSPRHLAFADSLGNFSWRMFFRAGMEDAMIIPEGNEDSRLAKQRLDEIDEEIEQFAAGNTDPGPAYVAALADKRAVLRARLNELRLDK